MNTKREQLEREITELTDQLKNLGAFSGGSLVKAERFCGSKGCACHSGGPKHPAMFITSTENGKTVSIYVPRKMEAEVEQWSQNYRKMKELMKQVTELRKQIIRLREE